MSLNTYTFIVGHSRTLSNSFLDQLDIKAVFADDVAAKKVGELGVVVLIILGRWLLPRGQLTRDQLSALLLGYIGMGADILGM